MASKNNIPPFVYANKDKKDTITENLVGAAVAEYRGVSNNRAIAISSRDNYRDVESNISVRDQYSRSDYDYFRPNERVPTKAKDILSACMDAYRRVGLVRNVIDLMSDFATQGIRIVHPDTTEQRFYRAWFKKVNGVERTERALNYLYRCGMFAIKRSMAKIKPSTERNMKSSFGETVLLPDVDDDGNLLTERRNIPIKYVFMNPLMLEPIGGELGPFIGKQSYAIKISNSLARLISSPSGVAKDMVKYLPNDIVESIKRGNRTIPLDSNKLIVRYYKKDDWNVWPDPMIYAILDDLNHLEKMKMADLAALDSVISQVRVWKLGDLDKGIFPTEIAVNRLIDILMSNPGGGSFDIVWGPELTFDETSTDVHNFLGEDKYTPVMNRIYAGLGVPPTLTGAATASGFTNNYISLQTLIQRLEYGRKVVVSFWEEEIELVRQAMGFERGARVCFDHNILNDEKTIKSLLIQLADRDVISVSTLAEHFNEDPEIEQIRIKKEMEARKEGLMNDKAGPWHSPEKIHEYIKMAISRGYLGLDLPDSDFPFIIDDNTPFEKSLQSRNVQNDNSPASIPKQGDQPYKGRPVGSKDSYKRVKTVKPLGASEDFLATSIWAKEALNRISNIVTPAILAHFNKPNQRSLSKEEIYELENMKFAILCSHSVFSDVTEDNIISILSNGLYNVPKDINEVYNKLVKYIVEKRDSDINIDESRILQVYSYALCRCNGE